MPRKLSLSEVENISNDIAEHVAQMCVLHSTATASRTSARSLEKPSVFSEGKIKVKSPKSYLCQFD